MNLIRVDPKQLMAGASTLEATSGDLQARGEALYQSSAGAALNPEYAAQIRGELQKIGAAARSRSQDLTSRLRVNSQALDKTGEAFEQADREILGNLFNLHLLLMPRPKVGDPASDLNYPDWLDKNLRPPWIDPSFWELLPEDDRLAILEDYRRKWFEFSNGLFTAGYRLPSGDDNYLDEWFYIYMFGLPDKLYNDNTGVQTLPYNPDSRLFKAPEMKNWDYGAWQYQNLPKLLAELRASGELDELGLSDLADQYNTDDWRAVHTRLCGVLSVGFSVGVVNMVEAILAMAAVDEQMLVKNQTAFLDQIRDLYKELGWEAEYVGIYESSEAHWDPERTSALPTVENVQNLLASGHAITALINIDASGNLTAAENINIGHYVDILEVMRAEDGTQYVRIYNSFDHQEEIYNWNDFYASWMHAGGNAPGQAVVATPPQP